jgi:hypothetical protein
MYMYGHILQQHGDENEKVEGGIWIKKALEKGYEHIN